MTVHAAGTTRQLLSLIYDPDLMKKILVPTDFTPGSLNAYEYAIRLAERMGSKVTLFHAYGFDGNNRYQPQSLTDALEMEDEEWALAALEGYGYTVQRRLEMEVRSTYILEKERPVKAVVEYADFMEADLIVMSTWWAEGITGSWLGNAGTKVIAQTSRPVLLVPEGVEFLDIDHIAYATNFKEEEQRIPKELRGLTETFSVQLSCLHVHRQESSYDPITYAFLREMYQLELDDFNIQFYTLNGADVLEGLEKFVQEKKVGLLAMMTHDRLTIFDRLLGPDIPRKMAFQTDIPLLILHQDFENN